MKKVIRIFDDREKFLNRVFLEKDPTIDLFTDIIPKHYSYLEYCTIVDKTQADGSKTPEYEMYRYWQIEPLKKEKMDSWNKWETNTEYHVFLDTLWDEETKLPDEGKHVIYGGRIYPKQLEDNLKSECVKTLSVYSTHDSKAAMQLTDALKKHREAVLKKGEYFPEITENSGHAIALPEKNDIKDFFLFRKTNKRKK